MLNYEVEPALLNRYVPVGTELDSFNGRTYISLVGFRFQNTKLLGRIAIPFHANFDEVNLRFYVRRKTDNKDRRGVVFIAEVVPRRAIASIARLVYRENYIRLPVRHRIETEEANKLVEYQWRVSDKWCKLFVQAVGAPMLPQDRSLEQFITEHYWGYSSQRSGSLVEYHVSHVPWRVSATTDAGFEGEADVLYGRELATIIQRSPDSAFVADGSPVIVFRGNRVDS